jgi:hypothetical protein
MIVRPLRGDFGGRDRCINHVCLYLRGPLSIDPFFIR